MKLRRKHKIKKVGDSEFQIRLNDHVLIEWDLNRNEMCPNDPIANVYIILEIGDVCIQLYICGLSKTEPVGEWILHDLFLTVGTDMENPVFHRDEENIDVKLHAFPSVKTWLNMAKERGAFA